MVLFSPFHLISSEFPSDITFLQIEKFPLDFVVVRVGQYMSSFYLHYFFLFLFFCLFPFSRATPGAYGVFQARGPIGAVAASLHQSHSNADSEPCLQPTPQFTEIPDP